MLLHLLSVSAKIDGLNRIRRSSVMLKVHVLPRKKGVLQLLPGIHIHNMQRASCIG